MYNLQSIIKNIWNYGENRLIMKKKDKNKRSSLQRDIIVNKKESQNHQDDINKKNMDKMFDDLIDKIYGSLLGPMRRKNIEKTIHFAFDILMFISENKPYVCNDLMSEIITSAKKYLVEKSIDFSTFNKEAKKIRDYMNEDGGRRWFTWDDPEISCIRASLALFIKMETKGDHEYVLSDTFLQIVECVNLNIELIDKDQLIQIINKHYL